MICSRTVTNLLMNGPKQWNVWEHFCVQWIYSNIQMWERIQIKYSISSVINFFALNLRDNNVWSYDGCPNKKVA